MFFIVNKKSQQKTHQTDIQKILDGIIIENNYIPKQNHIFIIYFSYFSTEKNMYFTNIIYHSKSMYFGWDDVEKNWGIYDYKGFEVFFISEKTIDISKEIKYYKKITDEKFQNENNIGWNYDPLEYSFYVNKKFKYLSPFHPDFSHPDLIEHRKNKFEKILKHSYYKKKTSRKPEARKI